MSESTFRTVGGLALYQAKSVCEFYFENFFSDIEKDEINRCYHIWLLPGLEDDYVEYFKTFWNKRTKERMKNKYGDGFRVYLFDPTNGVIKDSYKPYINK